MRKLTSHLGYFDSPSRHRCLCVNTIWRHGVLETILCEAQFRERHRRPKWHPPHWPTTPRFRCICRRGKRRCLRTCRTHPYPYASHLRSKSSSNADPTLILGLQTQSATNPQYTGPWDAIKKIYAKRGVAGIYKGQVVTLWREATGYAVYFWAYEKLMQREMATKHIKRDQVNPAKAVLFGAAAGYAVSISIFGVPRIRRVTIC